MNKFVRLKPINREPIYQFEQILSNSGLLTIRVTSSQTSLKRPENLREVIIPMDLVNQPARATQI